MIKIHVNYKDIILENYLYLIKIRANSIKNAPKINEDPKDALLRQYEEQIKLLKAQLEASNNGNVIYKDVQILSERQEKNGSEESDENNESIIKNKFDNEKKNYHSERLKMEKDIKEKDLLLANNDLEKEKLILRIHELEKDMNKKIVIILNKKFRLMLEN